MHIGRFVWRGSRAGILPAGTLVLLIVCTTAVTLTFGATARKEQPGQAMSSTRRATSPQKSATSPHSNRSTTKVPAPLSADPPVVTAPGSASASLPAQAPARDSPTSAVPTTVSRTTTSSPPVASTEDSPVATQELTDPQESIAPSHALTTVCGLDKSNTARCTKLALRAIDYARGLEGLSKLVLPTNWSSLTQSEQLFVASNLERVVRGLPPVSAMASELDAATEQAAEVGEDPSPPADFATGAWGGNWAWGFQNPLQVVYFWMYDDGLGSPNTECVTSDPKACWSHRNNILLVLPCSPCVEGDASETTSHNVSSMTELIAEAYGSPVADFTWAQEEPYLPAKHGSGISRSSKLRRVEER